MITKNTMRQFVSNNFQDAILSGKIVNSEVELSLSLKNLGEKFKSIPCFREDFEQIKKDSSALCNYLLESYLNNNTVIGINYFVVNRYYPGRTIIDVLTEEGTLTIALPPQAILKLIPNIGQRLESAKREGILKHLQNIEIDSKRKNYFSLYTKNSFRSGFPNYYSLEYRVLSLKKENEKSFIPKYEKEFLTYLLREIIKLGNHFYDMTYESLLRSIDYTIRNENVFMPHCGDKTINLGNISFVTRGNREEMKNELMLLREAVQTLQQEFEQPTPEVKQLTIQLPNGKRV